MTHAVMPVMAALAALVSVFLALPSGGSIARAESVSFTGEFHVVAGLASTTLGEGFPDEFNGDTVRVTLAAVALPSSDAGGSFRVVHTDPDGELVADLRGTLNCLSVEGEYAKATGVITYVDAPAYPTGAPEVGYVAGFVIADFAGGDSMAWAWDPVGATCDELPAVTAAEVERGGFVVR